MASPFTFKKEPQKWECGNDLSNITLVTFKAPGGAVGCAYCCNMNMDLDGEAQAYAPLSKPGPKPLDWLENAGFRSPENNEKIKVQWQAAKAKVAALEQSVAAVQDISSKFLLPPPSPRVLLPTKTKAGRPSDELSDARAEVKRLNPYTKDSVYNGAKIKYLDQKFWHWYGVRAYTPEQASKLSYTEQFVHETRKPILEKNPIYEDVFGRFPVIQSAYEPGPGYYVSVLATPINTRFPEWDQRYFSPFDPLAQRPYAALSLLLQKYVPVDRRDKILAIRPDTGETLIFPFLDIGNWDPKVGECSIEAFTLLGGKFAPPKYEGKPNPINNFPVLFLAFARSAGQSIGSLLAQFGETSNAADFSAMLAFLAQATADTLANKQKVIKREPMEEFQKWLKEKPASRSNPPVYDVINQSLAAAGLSERAERILQRHPSLVGGSGPWLTPPSLP